MEKNNIEQYKRYTRMALAVAFVALLIALYSVSVSGAKAISQEGSNFTIGKTPDNKVISFWDNTNKNYWYLKNKNGEIYSYWSEIQVQSWKTTGGGSWQTETKSYNNYKLDGNILIQNYTLDSGGYFNQTFIELDNNIKMIWKVKGGYNRNYRLVWYTNYIPTLVKNNSGNKRFIINDDVIFDWSDITDVNYTVTTEHNTNGKTFKVIVNVGNAYLEAKEVDPTISGGAVGYNNITCSNMNNGSYCNLSSPVNATNITAIISNIASGNASVAQNIYTPAVYNLIHNGQWVGQTFTANQSGNFVQINISLYKGGGLAIKPTNISLYNVSAGKPTGAVLAKHTFSTSDWINMESTNSMHLYTLNFTYPLNNTWLYAVAFETTEADTVYDEWRLGSTNTNTGYASGNSFYSTNQGASWTTLSYDHPFDIIISQPSVYTAWISEKTNISNSVINSSDGTATISFTDFLNPIQNFQCFNNISYNGFTCAISILYSGDTISSSETAVNGNYTQIINYIPENYATNVTLTFPINDATFTAATWKGALAYVTNLSANVTGGGYNATALWLNLSAIAANFNFTASLTIPYNNAPTGSISNQSFEAGNSMIVTCTANDAESNTLNISMTVNSTLKQGSSCSFDYTGLAIGNYSSQVNITDLNGTIGTLPYPWVNLTFWVNVSADVTPPTAPVISNGTVGTTTIVLNSTNNTEIGGWYLWEFAVNTTGNYSYLGNTTINITTATGLTAGQTYDFRLRVNDSSDNLSPYSNVITLQTLTVDPTDALILANQVTILNNQAQIQADLDDLKDNIVWAAALFSSMVTIAVLIRKKR